MIKSRSFKLACGNGRKALFLNPVRMESIVGMEDKEALALIDDLMRHAW